MFDRWFVLQDAFVVIVVGTHNDMIVFVITVTVVDVGCVVNAGTVIVGALHHTRCIRVHPIGLEWITTITLRWGWIDGRLFNTGSFLWSWFPRRRYGFVESSHSHSFRACWRTHPRVSGG